MTDAARRICPFMSGPVWSAQIPEPRLFQAECIGQDCVAWNKAVPVVHCVLLGGKARTVTPKTEQNLDPKSHEAIKRRIEKAVKENSDVSGRAKIDDVVASVVAQGNTTDEVVRKKINLLIRSGEVMELKEGIIKII